MALSTYSDLKTSIANFLARDDLTSQIPDFIELAEARMGRELDSRSQERRATASTVVGDGFISLPTDLREIRSVKLNTAQVKILDYYTPKELYTDYPSEGTGQPRAYTVIGTELQLRPVPDSVETIEIIYGEGLSALSDTNTSNTVLSRHPDAYLYGSLTAAYTFLLDENRAVQYDQLFTRIMDEIVRDTHRARFGGGLEMRTNYGGL
tara:strand:- start:170 stop:793 length:624 start_codon:yes stop_codon:yes gene_type:complete